ncbi:MAG: hypothetical protein AAB393_18930 [Bacteroidota bacterium]
MMRLLTIFCLGALLATVSATHATAQKKEQAKKEVTTPGQNTLKDVLSPWVGKQTNLGTLKRIAGDYFVLDDDGATVYHSLSAIHTLRLVKDEESGEMKLEIRLISKD